MCSRQMAQLVASGSALSPNGIGFSEEGMINMVQCDEVVKVDVEKQQVTVLAGARVSQVLCPPQLQIECCLVASQ